MELLNALNWRYATKRMTGEKLDDETVNKIIEAIRLAPTSAGLQPYHVFVISNPEIKAQLQPIAFGQPQIIESSHLLVFTSWDKITDESIDKVYETTNAQRGVPNEATADTVAGLKQLFSGFSEEEQYHHTAKQAHIGLGVAVAAAALLGVDATPMEGFSKEGVDEFLKLREKGLRSVALFALGKRKIENDWLYPLKKVRQPKEQFITEIK
ncbi:nitroreductase family protein [Chryseobacterium kwangjuense]|uniref:NAD(P)H-dependent oxidoreductase n=1 Tax=Chryseobacterium kwangjuense TaxID=267125 RepID=A0A135WF32_9FLAO|nr:nitroreductase family protein [Chryseobacterium kwangjuense]KXH83518.1 NAD(P)H-dependent oxidoreductase [Chryseobacterium kwangjuense]